MPITWSTETSFSTCILPLGQKTLISSTTVAVPTPNSKSVLSIER